MIFQKKNIPLFITFLLSVFVAIVFRNDCFMWDNVVIPSATASFFYDKGFHIFSMGNFLDCGHPPLISLYLATSWKIFGRNLLVSHLSQIPFVWLLIHQLYICSTQLFSTEIKRWALLFSLILFFADTTIVSQLAQVGYEIPMVAFCLLAINLCWKKMSNANFKTQHEILLWFSILILPFIQLRSIPLLLSFAFALLIFQFFQNKISIKNTVKILTPFMASAALFLCWLIIHFKNVGYWISDPNSAWGKDNVGIASLQQMIKNAGIVTIRFYDNGHALNVLMMIVVLVYFFNHANFKNKNYYTFLLWIWLIATVGLSLNFIIMSKPICHRYFLPSFILIPLFLSHFILTQLSKWKFISLAILLTVLISANFILPFKKYGIGWDSTLAHLPYNQLRKNAFDYLQKNNINANSCGTRFPFDVSDSLVFLNSSTVQLSTITQSNMAAFDYVLQSNISTSFTPQQINLLHQNYKTEKMWNKGLVEIRLYKKVH
ncbi:MAG: hypothetical protein RL708_472 [Bacteroidota bacterium]